MAKRLAWSSALIFIGVLFYWPLGRLLALTGFNLKLDDQAVAAVWFTLWQAVASTLIALVLALPVAHLCYRRVFAGRSLLRALVTVPFVLPVIVVAIGFSAVRKFLGLEDQTAQASIGWIIAAHVFFNIAVAVRTVGGVWASLDAATLEAARLDGAGKFREFWSVQLPQLRSAFLAAGSLIFLYCLTSFGSVLLIGGGQVHAIETEIYFSVTEYLDISRAGALAMVQLLLGLVVFSVASRFLSAESPLDAVLDFGVKRVSRRDWFSVAFTLLIVLGLIAPMFAVAWQAFDAGSANFANLAGQGARDVLNVSVAEAAGNSLRNIVVTVALSMGFGALVARLLVGRRNRFFELLFLAPLAVSSVVLGLGYLIGFAEPPLALRESWLAVPLAQTMVVLPLVIRILLAALQASDQELSQAASVDGANGWQTWWRVELPLIRQSFATALVFATVAGIGEFGTASLLVYGDQETLPTVLYRMIARPGTENFGMAMAASFLLILFTWLAVWLAGLTRETEPQPQRR